MSLFSYQNLIKVANKLDTESDLRDVMIIVAMVVSWFGFLRYSDVANLRAGEVTFHEKHARLWLRKSKTDQYAEGQAVIIACGTSIIDPVNILESFVTSSDRSGSDFLFCEFRKCKGQKMEEDLIGMGSVF